MKGGKKGEHLVVYSKRSEGKCYFSVRKGNNSASKDLQINE